MRVLQVMAGAEFGGAEAFFTRLVLALKRAGLDQRVVIRGNPARARSSPAIQSSSERRSDSRSSPVSV